MYQEEFRLIFKVVMEDNTILIILCRRQPGRGQTAKTERRNALSDICFLPAVIC